MGGVFLLEPLLIFDPPTAAVVRDCDAVDTRDAARARSCSDSEAMAGVVVVVMAGWRSDDELDAVPVAAGRSLMPRV